jgi:hypothetical protein
MNFEEQIENELERLFQADSLVISGGIETKTSGTFSRDFTADTLVSNCDPRVNIIGGLWDAQLTAYGLIANASDLTGNTLQGMYGIIANMWDTIKANPTLLLPTIGESAEVLTASDTITTLTITPSNFDEVVNNIPSVGSIRITNSAGLYEEFAYTAYDNNTGIFTVSHTLANDYAIGDTVKSLNLYCVDGFVNQNQQSDPLGMGEKYSQRTLSALLKVSYTP